MHAPASVVKDCALCGNEIREDEGIFLVRANHQESPTVICIICTLKEQDLFRADSIRRRRKYSRVNE
jgi:hypothetical protein